MSFLTGTSNHITLDGEKFYLDIPSAKMWTAEFVKTMWPIFQKLNKKVRCTPTYIGTMLTAKESDPNLFFYGAIDKWKPDIEEKDFMSSFPVDMTTQMVGWRPMLIPEISIAEKDGTITRGGTFYLDKKPQSTYRNSHTIFCPDGKTLPVLTIGDSVRGKELEWVVYQGNLICTDILAINVSYITLMKNGFTIRPTRPPYSLY